MHRQSVDGKGKMATRVRNSNWQKDQNLRDDLIKHHSLIHAHDAMWRIGWLRRNATSDVSGPASGWYPTVFDQACETKFMKFMA